MWPTATSRRLPPWSSAWWPRRPDGRAASRGGGWRRSPRPPVLLLGGGLLGRRLLLLDRLGAGLHGHVAVDLLHVLGGELARVVVPQAGLREGALHQIGDGRFGDAHLVEVLRRLEVFGQRAQRLQRDLATFAIAEAFHVLAHELADLAEELRAGEHVVLHDPREHEGVGDAVRHVEHAADGVAHGVHGADAGVAAGDAAEQRAHGHVVARPGVAAIEHRGADALADELDALR